MSDYPEHDKLTAITAESQTIGAFLENSGFTLCTVGKYNDLDGNRYIPVRKSINSILADYFGIDLDEIEREKRAMLEVHRTLDA